MEEPDGEAGVEEDVSDVRKELHEGAGFGEAPEEGSRQGEKGR